MIKLNYTMAKESRVYALYTADVDYCDINEICAKSVYSRISKQKIVLVFDSKRNMRTQIKRLQRIKRNVIKCHGRNILKQLSVMVVSEISEATLNALDTFIRLDTLWLKEQEV